jgi:hypothetical protein
MKQEVETTLDTETQTQEPSLFQEILAANPYTAKTRTEAKDQASIVAASGLYGVKSKEEAYLILMTGRDLGLSESQALRGIRVFNNMPCVMADTLHAIVENSPLCEYFREVESTDDHATYETKRRGNPPTRSTFTMEQAKRAGLLGKNNWKCYPHRMLRARAKSYLARDVYPDVTLGMYTTEEMDGDEAEPTIAQVDPIPDTPIDMVPTDPEPWQQRMRDAGNVRLATQIGKDAYEASDRDPAVKAEALAILKEMEKA